MIYHSEDRCKSDLGKSLLYWRSERPDEWKMDEWKMDTFIMDAEILNAKKEALEELILECTENGEIDGRLFNSYMEHCVNKCKEGR